MLNRFCTRIFNS